MRHAPPRLAARALCAAVVGAFVARVLPCVFGSDTRDLAELAPNMDDLFDDICDDNSSDSDNDEEADAQDDAAATDGAPPPALFPFGPRP